MQDQPAPKRIFGVKLIEFHWATRASWRIGIRLAIGVLLLLNLSGNWSIAAPVDVSRLRTQLAAAEKAENNEAIAELGRRILDVTPTDSSLWEKVADAQLALKNYDQCKATLDHWQVAVKPPPPIIEDFRGDIAFAKDRFKEAESHWLKFVAAKPPRDDAADTYQKLGNLYVSQSHWQENLDCRTRVVALRDTAANRVDRADALLRLHRWGEAYAEMARANRLDAVDQTVKEALPQYERLQRFLPRLKELDAEIAKSPNEWSALLDQARLFTIAGLRFLALQHCQRALKIQPASMRARIQTAEALLDTDDAEGAAKLQVSSKLKRTGEDKHVSDGALRELGETDALLLQNSKNPEPLVTRARVLHNLDQFTLALADGEAALAVDDKSAEAHLAVARDLDELGRKKEALEHARRATELAPQDWMKWTFRGMLEKERADFAAAIESQTRSLSIHESSIALSERENCERRLGKTAEADVDLHRLHELKP